MEVLPSQTSPKFPKLITLIEATNKLTNEITQKSQAAEKKFKRGEDKIQQGNEKVNFVIQLS